MRPMLKTASLVSVIMIVTALSLAQTSGNGQLTSEYRKWVDEDVRWIITDQERKSFLHLSNNDDRDRFVADFWEQRNPTPSTQANPFKEEHYRRLAFANEHFAAGVPGWKTDRGRVYIVYGPPDSIQTRASASTAPAQQVWVYEHMQGRSGEVKLRFLDNCECGNYQLVTPLPDAQ